MRYTALGDSITAGEAATRPSFAYPGRLTSLLMTRSAPADVVVLAEPGWTSAALAAAVFDNSAQPLQANAISIWVGGDNLVDGAVAVLHGAPASSIARSIAQYGRDLAVLCAGIRRVSRAPLILCTQYNPFPNTPIAGQGVGALNAATRAVAARIGATIAPVDEWFAGHQAEWIASYRSGRIQDALHGDPAVHPNNAGHLVIARGLLPLIR